MLRESEKDYFMRMIKELVQVLFSVLLGKTYMPVEADEENQFTVSGKGLDEWKAMVDGGQVNEAENLLLEELNYDDRREVAAAALFYRYISEKEEAFLKEADYSAEEAYDGLRRVAERAGYGVLI